MFSSLEPRFIVSFLAALAFAGCAHRPARSLGSAQVAARSEAENLRSVRRPLLISHDRRHGDAILEIADPQGGASTFLYLNPKDEARLRARVSRSDSEVEIRYWEQLKQVFPDGRELPVGELESVIDGASVLLDRSFCELHHLKMPRKPAPVVYGRASPSLVEAWTKFFPNAAIAFGGIVVADDSPETEIKYVCPACDETYAQWSDSRRND